MDGIFNDSFMHSSFQEHTSNRDKSFSKCNCLNKNNDELVPRIGMTFGSIDEAYQFYMVYAYCTGFGVMKRSCHSIDGIKYRAAFVCIKQGKPKIRPGPRSRRRLVAKSECKAMIVIKDLTRQNQWEIDYIELNHNHPCDPEMVRFMKCFRDLPDWQRNQRPFNFNARLAKVKVKVKPMIKHVDRRPLLQNGMKLRLLEGDAEALMKFFDKMQVDDPNFFYSWDLDAEGQLKNVFWADARSRASYKYFGDVVNFDTTYLSEQYVVPLVAFLGVNHHGQSILLGCGLLGDETVGTYIWIFNKWLRCMNDRPPDRIITSHSKAIAEAVSEVFKSSQHRFSLWEIMKDLPETSGMVEERETIGLRFKKVICDPLTGPEFEREWGEMIQQHCLQENTWLNYLFENRKKWVPVFVRDEFWAGLSTLYQAERLDSFFEGYVNLDTKIKMFVEIYEVAIGDKIDREAYDDFRSFQNRTQLFSGLQFEDQIAKIYTINMVQKFQDQVKQLMHVICTKLDQDGNLTTYNVTVLGRERKTNYTVMYNKTENDIRCVCRLFEFRGILCCHALGVLRQEFVTIIPEKYILDRWRKDYKRLGTCKASPNCTQSGETRLYDFLYRNGQQYFSDIVEVGSIDSDYAVVALSAMKEARDKVVKYGEVRENGNK